MTPKRGKTQIPIEEIAQSLSSGIQGSDTARADALDSLSRLSKARSKGLNREKARLSARLGAKHPRVQAVEKRIANEGAVQSRISLEVARARTSAPAGDPNNFVLHGRVLRELKPVSGLTVALLDAKSKERFRNAGFAVTDDTGYFKLECPPVVGTTQGGKVIGLFQEEKLVHIDDVTVSPQPGQVTYREVVLAAGKTRREKPVEPAGGPTPAAVGLESLTLQRPEARGGESVQGRVYLSGTAPDNATVDLSLSYTPAPKTFRISAPQSVEVKANRKSATFEIKIGPTRPAKTPIAVIVTASHGGVEKQATLKVKRS